MNAEAYAELDATVTAVANPLVNHHGIYGTGLEIISDNILWRTNIQVVDPNVRLAGDFEIVDPFKLQQDNRQFTSEFFSVRPNYQKQSYFTSELLINNYNHQIGLYGVYLLEGRDSLGDDFLSDAPNGILPWEYHRNFVIRDGLQLVVINMICNGLIKFCNLPQATI